MNKNLVLASVAAAFIAGGVGAASAQGAPDTATGVPSKKMRVHGHAARVDQAQETNYRPLTVGGPRVAAPAAAAPVGNPADALAGIGNGIAAPFNSAAAAGGPLGAGFGIAGGAIGGATTLATAPIAGLFGGQVGISPNAATPLPIKARYAHTGPVAASFDEGYTQEVPVDKSGPIYMLDNEANQRKVTPASLLAFPLTAPTAIISSTLHSTVAPAAF